MTRKPGSPSAPDVRRLIRGLAALTLSAVVVCATAAAQDPAPEPPPLSPLKNPYGLPTSSEVGGRPGSDPAVERASVDLPAAPIAIPAGAAASPYGPPAGPLAGAEALKPFGAYFPGDSLPRVKETLPDPPASKAGSTDDWVAGIRSTAEHNDRTLSSLDEAIRRHPDRAEAFFERGSFLAQLARADQKEKLDAAMADLSRAVALKPGLVEARQWRAYVATLRQEWDAAVADFSWVIERQPENVVAVVERGETLMRQGEYDRAIADFDRADGRLRQSPEKVWACRAWCHAAMGRHDRAIADYTRAIDYATISETWIYVGRAQSYRATHDPDRALADLDRAIAFMPDDAAVHFLRANILLEKRDYSAAVEEAGQLARLLPNHPGPHFLRSVAAWMEGQEEDRALAAVARYATVAEQVFPCAPAPRLVRELATATIGRGRKEALAALDRFLAIEPRLSFVYVIRAILNAQEGRFLPTCRDLSLFVATFHRRNYHFYAYIDRQRQRFEMGLSEFIPAPEAASRPKPAVADLDCQCMDLGFQQLLASATQSPR